ncbi:MAG: GntR family transcriptional regulator [Clostridiales bacterium]|nr:GntR family transcriptional regulator [Clostridiales bacterium]
MSAASPQKQITNFLMEIIKQASFEANYKMPSERMLATKFATSRRSIRLAYQKLIDQGLLVNIHGKGYFTTEKTKTSIATDLRSKKKIYFIVPAIRTSFAQDILYGITDFCDEHMLDVSIKLSKSNPAKEAQYIHSAFSSDVKGVILFPTDNELVNHELLQLSAKRYPIAIIDRYFKNINSSFVSTDNYNAMIEAVKFLHAKKYKRLLYLTSPSSLATSVEERLNGYLAGISKYFGQKDKQSVLTSKMFSSQEIYNDVTAYLKANPETEVIITNGSRTITDAVISAANALNLSIPKDIKLMLFDNDFSSTEAKLIRPYVIQQDAYQIGYRSAATLYNQLYGDLHTEIIRLPVKILDFTEEIPQKIRQ